MVLTGSTRTGKQALIILIGLLLLNPSHSFTSIAPKRFAVMPIKHVSSMWPPSTLEEVARQPSHLEATGASSLSSSSAYLVRIVFLRALAFVYGVAFLVALRQNKALIGDSGIVPARLALDRAEERGRLSRERRLEWRRRMAATGFDGESAKWSGVQRYIGAFIDRHPHLIRLREIFWDRTDGMERPVTSVLWLARDRGNLNPWLDNIARCGLAMAGVMFLAGSANVPLLLGLWICQRSLMAVGGPFYGYGWEPQLAELGFHAMFLVPLLSMNQLPTLPVPPLVNWTMRWYLFRIMMGAGLIKIKSGDRKWKDLTTMDYFYETQPVPNPLTRYMHWMPGSWHKFEVLMNHFVELIAPVLLIIPGMAPNWRRAGGLIQIIFQIILISTGNLSFLNWLTMVPAILCFDDAFLAGLFGPTKQAAAAAAAGQYSLSASRQVVSAAFTALIMYLSVPVVRNLVAKRQVMNGSFDKLRLVNTYGAFGTVHEDRDEFIISSACDLDGPWREYEFHVKPGDVNRSPKFISPYHHRLDWQMWIAALCRSLDRSPWIFTFLLKLLQQDRGVVGLIAKDPWASSSEKPRFIRIDLFRYRFHKPRAVEKNPPYWDRQYLGRVYPRQGVATVEILKEEVKARLPRRPK